MVNLEEIMLREEDRMDREVINIESNKEEKSEDDDMEIPGASSREPKQIQFE